MNQASARGLRYRFNELERRLREGDEIQNTTQSRHRAAASGATGSRAQAPRFQELVKANLWKEDAENQRGRTAGRGARPLLSGYADTSFLVSVSAPDGNSHLAVEVMHHINLPIF